MNETNVNKNNKTKMSNLQGWDAAIQDAKRRIKELEYSVEVFEKNKRSGRPFSSDWLKDETAGTVVESIPAEI